MTTHGINGPSPSAHILTTTTELSEVAPLSGGSPEELIAQVAVRLEEAGARDADVSRQMRRSQTRANRASLDDKRKAAKLQLAAGLVQATASAVQGAVSLGQASQGFQAADSKASGDAFQQAGMGDQARIEHLDSAQHTARGTRLGAGGGLAEAAGQAASSVIGYFGQRASIEAEEHTYQAEEHAQSSQTADEARESAQRFADKAMQHMAEIEEAKHRATMAALRG